MKPRSAPHPEASAHLLGFLDYIQAELGLSINTRKAYRADLLRFLGFLAETDAADPARLRAAHIERFLVYLKDAGLAVSTIARNLAAVRMFCRYLVIERIQDRDVSEVIETPRNWSRLPTVLDHDTVQQILDAPDPSQDAYALRDQALLTLLYATGMRAAELAGLKLPDVNANLGVVRVLGKGSKERLIPLAGRAIDMLQAYQRDLRPQLLAGEQVESVFLSRTGRPLAREDVFRIVKKYVRRAGLGDKVSPHTLRHCFATQLLAGGADLRAVQEMLGHADISTTQIYTHVDADRLRAVHQKFHPRS